MENNMIKEENNNDLKNKKEDENNNKKVNYITGIASILVLLPTAIILINFFAWCIEGVRIVDFNIIIPILIIIGMSLLVYIRITYSDNNLSKQLIKICIVLFIVMVLLNLIWIQISNLFLSLVKDY